MAWNFYLWWLYVMFLTPGCSSFMTGDPQNPSASKNIRPHDDIDEIGPVIVAGVGRFGQIVNRVLVASGSKRLCWIMNQHKLKI